jgi:hypothetical protein
MANSEVSKPILKLLLMSSLALLLAQVSRRALKHRESSGVATAVALKVNDALPSVRIRTGKSSKSTDVPARLHDLVRHDRCSILVFFDSSCPICRDMAPSWSSKRFLDVGGDSLPIHWIAINPADTGAAGFIARYRLSEPYFTLVSDADRASLGVTGTPAVFLVDSSMKFLGRRSGEPAQVSIPERECENLAGTL